jgi:hypothetical protein
MASLSASETIMFSLENGVYDVDVRCCFVFGRRRSDARIDRQPGSTPTTPLEMRFPLELNVWRKLGRQAIGHVHVGGTVSDSIPPPTMTCVARLTSTRRRAPACYKYTSLPQVLLSTLLQRLHSSIPTPHNYTVISAFKTFNMSTIMVRFAAAWRPPCTLMVPSLNEV